MIEKYRQQALSMMQEAKNKDINYNTSYQSQKEHDEIITAPQNQNTDTNSGSKGYMIINVTKIKGLYPVHGADITVFTESPENMNVIDTSKTDENGKSKIFTLPTPSKDYSLTPDNTATTPYSLYNLLITAQGYVSSIVMNIPVFDSITSIQNIDLLDDYASGGNSSPIISDEKSSYRL